jgi:polar amino acid transport system permease protein
MGYHLDFHQILSGQYLDWLISGVITTLELSIGAWLLAFAMAIALILIRMAPFKPCEWLVMVFVEYHQNVPILVQIFFWYFAAPELLPTNVKLWVNSHDTEFILALLALSFCFSAYMSEDLRSGARAVPKTQYEASRALGFGYVSTMRYVIVPQALRIAVPPLVNHTLLLFKNSSLAMSVGVAELTYQTREIENHTFRTFEAFAVATVIYLVISFAIMGVGGALDRRAKLYQLQPS